MSTRDELARRLRAARERLDLTQLEVAQRIPGYTISRISNYETGYRSPDIPSLNDLAVALETTVPELLGICPTDLLPPRERTLLAKYRQADESGKDTIHRIAEMSAALQADQPKPKTNAV